MVEGSAYTGDWDINDAEVVSTNAKSFMLYTLSVHMHIKVHIQKIS